MSHYASSEDILSFDDGTYEDVPVPEWSRNGTPVVVRLRSLTGEEREDFEARSIVGSGNNTRINTRNMRARLIQLCAVNVETGEPLFSAAQVMKLSQKNAAALDKLFAVAQRLCGLTEDDVKELEEGFGAAQNASSISV